MRTPASSRQQTAIVFLTTVVNDMAKTAESQPANRVYYGELIDALQMMIHIAKTSKPSQWDLQDSRIKSNRKPQLIDSEATTAGAIRQSVEEGK